MVLGQEGAAGGRPMTIYDPIHALLLLMGFIVGRGVELHRGLFGPPTIAAPIR